MPSLVTTLEGTIARAGSQLGQWWPNSWWPGGIPTYNDCAAFVSWCLWGLHGGSPYEYIVSGIIERSGLEFHAGSAGIRRGDIPGYRWSTLDNYDHTAVALSSPSPLGLIQSLEANGGGDDRVAIHTRSIKYIHNYARPQYPTTVVTGGGGTPITEGDIMQAFSYTSASKGVVTFIAQPGLYVKGCAATEPAALGIPVNGPLSLGDLNAAMWDLGFDDMVGGAVDAWSFLSQHCHPGTVFTTAWAKAQAGGTVLTDAQATAIADQVAAKVVIPATDLSGLAASIAALDTQADTYQADLKAILAKGLTGTVTVTPAK